MDKNLSQHFQDCLPNSNGGASQDRQQPSFQYTAAETPRSTEWSFAPGPRQHNQTPTIDANDEKQRRITALWMQSQAQQQVAYDAYGLPALNASQHSSILPPTSTSMSGSSRLSLGSQNNFNRQDRDQRTVSNADNYFKIRQNLHQGVSVNPHAHTPTTNAFQESSVNQHIPATNLFQDKPISHSEPASSRLQTSAMHRYTPASDMQPLGTMSQTIPRSIPLYTHNVYPIQESEILESPLSRIANGMLFNRQLAQARSRRPEAMNAWQSSQVSSIDQSQPHRQGNTSRFEMAGFKTPAKRHVAPSSSPVTGQASSPTERVSLRRSINKAPTHHEYSDDASHDQERPRSQSPQYPQHSQQNYSQSLAHRPPKALILAHAPPMAHGIQLVSPRELPDRIRQVFPYELFNAVQSRCYQTIYHTNDNIVVSAPTGSGKTALLELAICKLIEGHPSGNFKIVYQAPTKALCSERLRDWEKKFSHLNLPCAELTGDTSQKEMSKVRNATIIVTTPEKWDSITRKWTDHDKLVEMVKLFLIDEVHILKDTRGATLEAVVSRTKKKNSNVRFVALSATVPNSDDIAVWLGKDHSNGHLPAHKETFGEDFRPVKLQKHVFGFDGSQRNDFMFEKILDGKLPNLVQKHSQGKPIMIFCFTRKSCENTAAILAEWWTRQRVTDRSWPAPRHNVTVESKQLQELVESAVAFHHAGLDTKDRLAIESGYLKGDINVICCTSTLAVGVNLPCHLVVLKGTVGYQDGVLNEYADLEVMQMLGRAGRPQFDDSAVAVIMTRNEKLDRYKKMVSGQDILESTLHLNLIEHLNSEIGLRTIHNTNTAKEWLKGTFLSVRMRQNPNHYKMEGVPETRDTDYRLELVCERDIKLLREAQLITDADDFGCTEYGQAMSRYMVQFETMKLLLGIPRKAKTEEILFTICQASEFKDLRIRPVERPHLREFNKSPFMKFPIKENVSTTTHKIILIVQVQLGGIEHPNDKEFNTVRRQFGIDKGIIFDRINRLVRCVIDCKAHDCDAVSTRNALDLARSLWAGYWENSNLQLRQVSGIGPAAARRLVSSNITSIEALATKQTSDLERIMSKNPPYGKKLLDLVIGFPRLQMVVRITKQVVKPRSNPRVNILVTLSYQNNSVPIWKNKKPALTFMAETSDGTLVHMWRGNVFKLEKNPFEIRFSAEVPGLDEVITCHVACEEVVGTMRTTIIKPSFPASAFPVISLLHENGETSQSELESDKIESDDSDEFGAGEIADDEFLEVASKLDVSTKKYDTDGFADIDDFDSERIFKKSTNSAVAPSTKVPAEPLRMPNGKWSCNHICSGGELLKNGQFCKHKCCKEGLDKPRKLRPKSSAVTKKDGELDDEEDRTVGSVPENAMKNSHGKNTNRPKPPGTHPKTTNRKFFSNTKLKENYPDSDLDSVELVDLAEDLPPFSYAQVGPRDYRKLHTLHNSIQGDKSVRLPKRNPQPSHSNIEHPGVEDYHVTSDLFDDDSIGDDDFPSHSQLFARSESVEDVVAVESPEAAEPHEEFEDVFESLAAPYQKEPISSSSYDGGSMEAFESDQVSHGYTDILKQHTPMGNSSFDNAKANDLFDFDAFEFRSDSAVEDMVDLNQNSAAFAGSSLHISQKRELSPCPDIKPPKRQHISKEEENRKRLASKLNTPSWVDEFDAELIDGLKEYVEFVD